MTWGECIGSVMTDACLALHDDKAVIFMDSDMYDDKVVKITTRWNICDCTLRYIYKHVHMFMITVECMGLVISGVCLALHDDKAMDKVNEFIDVHNEKDIGMYIY